VSTYTTEHFTRASAVANQRKWAARGRLTQLTRETRETRFSGGTQQWRVWALTRRDRA